MKLSEKIDCFTGVISSGNTPALGPVAEEVKCLTVFTDGCTDFLFEKAVPNPHYVFRLTNIQSADGAMAAIAAAQAWPEVRKIAHLHPDYSYGRNAFDHFNIVHEEAHPGQARRRVGGVAEARDHRVHGAHHEDDLRQAGPLVRLGVGRRLHRLLQAGPPLRPVQEDEGGDDPRFRRRAARARQGPPGGDRGGRPRQLPLPLSARESLAAERRVRQEVPRPLEGVSELRGGGRIHRAPHAEDRDREGQPPDRRLAGRGRDHRHAGRSLLGVPGRATCTSGPTTTRATRTPSRDSS